MFSGLCNWLNFKTVFWIKHFAKREKTPWKSLLSSALVMSVIATKSGGLYAVCTQGRASATRGFTLGLKFSSVLEQSVLDLSTRIFRSISRKILWSLYLLCCCFRVKYGREAPWSCNLPAATVGSQTEQTSTPKPPLLLLICSQPRACREEE